MDREKVDLHVCHDVVNRDHIGEERQSQEVLLVPAALIAAHCLVHMNRDVWTVDL